MIEDRHAGPCVRWTLPNTLGKFLVEGHGNDRTECYGMATDPVMRPSQASNVLSHVRRPPHLRLCCLPFALASLLLLPLSPLLPILRLLTLPLVSRILILLSCPSHQCTSERARAVKIIRG
jgi:hypothetical protein